MTHSLPCLQGRVATEGNPLLGRVGAFDLESRQPEQPPPNLPLEAGGGAHLVYPNTMLAMAPFVSLRGRIETSQP
jgi:hypothetical protein